MVETGVKLERVRLLISERFHILPVRRDSVYHLLRYYRCVDDTWTDRVDTYVLFLHFVNMRSKEWLH
jgi:hypothetical protein